MTLAMHAGWNFASIGSFSIQITDSGGSATIAYSSGRYAWIDVSSIDANYASFAAALQTTLNANATLAGTFTVSLNTSTLILTITSTHSFSAASANTVAQRLLGMSGATISSGTSYASPRKVWYSIAGEQGAASDKTDDYEPEYVVSGTIADDGSPYGIAVTTPPKFSDFVVPYEPRAKIFKRAADASAPFTFEHLFEHVRVAEPIAVVDDVETTLHKLRPESAAFAPDRIVANYDDFWSVMFKTVVLGRL